MLDQLNEAAASLSGTWVKLRTTDDPPVEGKVLDFEDRAKTFEGAPVLSRKSGTQRREWVFTIDAGGDDPVKLSLNEAGQRAVAAALREAGSKAVAADPPGDREQATYKARWTPAPAGLGVPATSDSGADPF
jgi:hypothetical protein